MSIDNGHQNDYNSDGLLGEAECMVGSCKKFRAFTLVELLVVISITALLLGILLPALHRARAQARSVVCQSILRNIALAHKQYTAETGMYLPHTNYEPYTPWYNNDYFRQAMGLPIVPDEQKQRRSQIQEWPPNMPRGFICPDARYALTHPENGLYPMDRSYGVNVEFDAHALRRGTGSLLDKESWVRDPATKIFLADALDWWITYLNCRRYLEYGENYVGFETYGAIAYRHSGRVNVIYWDGHVGQLPAEQVVENTSLWYPFKLESEEPTP